MSLLVVGLSHRSASMPLLEKVSLRGEAVAKLLDDAASSAAIDEVMLLATCNRVELYAAVDKFHAGVSVLSELLAQHADVPFDELAPFVYVHYEDRAAQHLFSVAASLDSMLVGEQQILGQVRSAFKTAQERGDAAAVLNEAVQHALHAAKRAHTETDIDAAGTSLVDAALRMACPSGLVGRRTLIVGAGAMASVAAAALAASGVESTVVVSRTLASAQALASRMNARSASMDELETQLSSADVVVSCTGAEGFVLSAALLARVVTTRPQRPLAVVDVALPRDVEPSAAAIDGITVVDLDDLKPIVEGAIASDSVREARRIVDEELAIYVAGRRAAGVAPTVVALRDKAAQVVDAELRRLEHRLPQLDESAHGEIAAAVRRVVEKVLHSPTVRVQELAGLAGPQSYPEALRRLFDLDPATPAVIAAPESVGDDA